MNCPACQHNNAYKETRSYEQVGLRHFIVTRRFCLQCDSVMEGGESRVNDAFPHGDHKRSHTNPTHCAECSLRWPCDMVLLADELRVANGRIYELEHAGDFN